MGKELEKYYGGPLVIAETPAKKSFSKPKYPVGSLAIWDEKKVKVVAYDPDTGYELEYADTGDWADNEVSESELRPVAR